MRAAAGGDMVRDASATPPPPPPLSALGSVVDRSREEESDRSRAAADGAGGKAQVARDVCAASAAYASCAHRRRRSPRRAPFVDWYLVLAVGEAASEDAVRRRYRHLALQLHPDKNRHPKAEMAFKIVSEAHACLTDKARRRAFDAERSTAFCAVCHERARGAARHRAAATETRTFTPSDHHRQQLQPQPLGGAVAKPRGGDGGGRSTAAAPAQALLREVQNRLRNECRVIDGCLRANSGGARRRQSFPLFDPSDRQRFPDYPHTRPTPSPPSACRSGMFWSSEDRSCFGGGGSRGSCESPVYQIRTAPERAARTYRRDGDGLGTIASADLT